MVKKKSKKEANKKDKKKKEKKRILEKLKVGKKKGSKKKDPKKKDSKKKDSKKKDSKKKDSKKKDSKKKKKAVVPAQGTAMTPEKKPAPLLKTVSKPKPATKRTAAPKQAAASKPGRGAADRSSNYKVHEAIAKLRSMKTEEELMAFIKGEKRVTVTKVIPAKLNRLKK